MQDVLWSKRIYLMLQAGQFWMSYEIQKMQSHLASWPYLNMCPRWLAGVCNQSSIAKSRETLAVTLYRALYFLQCIQKYLTEFMISLSFMYYHISCNNQINKYTLMWCNLFYISSGNFVILFFCCGWFNYLYFCCFVL